MVQGVYDAFARGDIADFFSRLTPDMRWFEAKGHPHGGIHVGADATVKNVLTRLGAEWENFTAVNDSLVAQGDTVVSLHQHTDTALFWQAMR